ncbi:MAG: hypothetical protein ACM3X4_07670 [Ignavibacteriales bacterium]
MNSIARRRLFVALVCFLLGCSTLAGYRFSSQRRNRDGRPVAAPSQPAAPRVVLKILYRNCGHTLEPAGVPAGRSLQEIVQAYPGARVTLLENGDAEVISEVDGLCPEDAPYRLVCLKDGFVAVYYGRKPLDTNLMELRRDLPAGRIPKRDVEKLTGGEVVVGDAAVARLLEGLLD